MKTRNHSKRANAGNNPHLRFEVALWAAPDLAFGSPNWLAAGFSRAWTQWDAGNDALAEPEPHIRHVFTLSASPEERTGVRCRYHASPIAHSQGEVMSQVASYALVLSCLTAPPNPPR